MLKRLIREEQVLKLKDKLHAKKIKREDELEHKRAMEGLAIGTVILGICIQINLMIR